MIFGVLLFTSVGLLRAPAILHLIFEFLNKFFRFPLQLLCLDVNWASLLIVELTVGPDQLYFCKTRLKGFIIIMRHVGLDRLEVHGLFDYLRIVPETHSLPWYRLVKRERIRVFSEFRDHQFEEVLMLRLDFRILLFVFLYLLIER